MIMKKTRTDVNNLLTMIKNSKERYVFLEKEITLLSNQAEYNRTVEHYDDLINILTKELQALPIGYRYTGTYYLKKPYIIPYEFEECHGSLFMKEHLVSWQIEKEPGVCEYPYYRAVYKQPAGALINRDDGKPVYPSKK